MATKTDKTERILAEIDELSFQLDCLSVPEGETNKEAERLKLGIANLTALYKSRVGKKSRKRHGGKNGNSID